MVEANPDTAPLTEGVAQAKDYASKLRLRFTDASNGLGVYAHRHGQRRGLRIDAEQPQRTGVGVEALERGRNQVAIKKPGQAGLLWD